MGGVKLGQPVVKELLETFNILALNLVQLSLEVGLHGDDLVVGEAGGTEVCSTPVLLPSGGQENSPADLADDSTQVGPELAGVRTPDTAAVKVPVLTDLLLALDVAQHRGHVLDGDLLPRLDVGLSHQVEGAVPEDVELGVTETAVGEEGEGRVEGGVEAVSLAGHSQADRVGLQDSHRPHHVALAVGTGGKAPGERMDCSDLPHLPQVGAGHDVRGVVHQHLHPTGRVRAGDPQPEEPHHVDEAHGGVGGLPQGEGDVDVEAGEEAALNTVVRPPGTVLVTDRELTVGTGEASPASQAVAALGAGLEVGAPDGRLLSQDGLAGLDVPGGDHAVAHPVPGHDGEGQTAVLSPRLTVDLVVTGGAGGDGTGGTGDQAWGPAQPTRAHLTLTD